MENCSLTRDRILNLGTLAQLAYVAHKRGESVVQNILKSGSQPFVTVYQHIQFFIY